MVPNADPFFAILETSMQLSTSFDTIALRTPAKGMMEVCILGTPITFWCRSGQDLNTEQKFHCLLSDFAILENHTPEHSRDDNDEGDGDDNAGANADEGNDDDAGAESEGGSADDDDNDDDNDAAIWFGTPEFNASDDLFGPDHGGGDSVTENPPYNK